MAAYAAVASLMNIIDHMKIHPLFSTSLDTKQIDSVQQKADDLLDFINYNDFVAVSSKQVQDLERRIACAARDAEDVIESRIVVHVTHAGSGQSSRGCFLALQKIIHDMDAILIKVAEVKEMRRLSEEEQRPSASRPVIESARETTGTMVGFDDELLQLMDELTSEQSNRHIISIAGMGGTGKTTLALNLYHSPHFKHHFDIRAWVTVSQQYNAREILSQLLSSSGHGNKSSGTKTLGELGEELHKTLWGRRYLIILDDIWSVEAWDEVCRFFPDNGNRSRVVLTTRMSNVARDCSSSSCFSMKPLDEHINWKLFCKKAFEREDCPYPELEIVGKEIARLCRGLPLSTVVIGGLLLKSPKSVPFWEKFVRNIKSVPISKEKEESLDILSLSYNHLPPHLKPCFMYMGVLKEDSVVRASKIINLWIAEGFLRPNNMTYMLEEVGEGYLNELIDRNLILEEVGVGRNGKIGSCGIHDLLRDICLKVGMNEKFFHSCQKLNIFWDGGDIAISEVTYRNVNLRYLACRPHTLDEPWAFPRSISLMLNLKTLIIRGEVIEAFQIVVAPIEIWTMPHLRHVNVKFLDFHVPDPPVSDGLVVMEKLRTLTSALNLRVSEEVCERIPNIKKLHMLYQQGHNSYDDSLIECLHNLEHLHKLETLKLIIYKIDQWKEVMNKMRFPISLNKLSLIGCKLRWEHVSVIGSLPRLEVLELGANSVVDKGVWSPIDGQFLLLKVLKLNDCDI